MNRLVKVFACALFASVIVGGSSQASAMNISGVSQSMTIGEKTVTASDENGAKIKFVSDGKVLRLMSADGTKDFLSFNSFDGIYSGVDYSVRVAAIGWWATILAVPGPLMCPGTALPIWASAPTGGMISKPPLKTSSWSSPATVPGAIWTGALRCSGMQRTAGSVSKDFKKIY